MFAPSTCGAVVPAQAPVADLNAVGLLAFTPALRIGVGAAEQETEQLFDGARYASGYHAFAHVLVDLGGDGHLDRAVSNRYTDHVTVRLAEGDGSFAEPMRFGVGDFPVDVALGDVDGDGVPDVVTANLDLSLFGAVHEITGARGLGGGAFAAPQSIDVIDVIDEPDTLATGDPNGDGNVELLVMSTSSSGLILLVRQRRRHLLRPGRRQRRRHGERRSCHGPRWRRVARSRLHGARREHARRRARPGRRLVRSEDHPSGRHRSGGLRPR